MDALSDAPLAAPSAKSLSSSQLLKRFDRVRSPKSSARGGTLRCRRERAIDARRVAEQMALGAHDVVLRDVRASRLRRRTIPPFDPSFSYLYNSYYEAEGERIARQIALDADASVVGPEFEGIGSTSTPRCGG